MKIDYGIIVKNALSVIVAAVFVGAATIAWKAATTMGGPHQGSKGGSPRATKRSEGYTAYYRSRAGGHVEHHRGT